MLKNRLEKYMNYLLELGLILSYVAVRLEKYSDYLTRFRLTLYIGVGLEKLLGKLVRLRLVSS